MQEGVGGRGATRGRSGLRNLKPSRGVTQHGEARPAQQQEAREAPGRPAAPPPPGCFRKAGAQGRPQARAEQTESSGALRGVGRTGAELDKDQSISPVSESRN